jgi:hypothetical protein
VSNLYDFNAACTFITIVSEINQLALLSQPYPTFLVTCGLIVYTFLVPNYCNDLNINWKNFLCVKFSILPGAQVKLVKLSNQGGGQCRLRETLAELLFSYNGKLITMPVLLTLNFTVIIAH